MSQEEIIVPKGWTETTIGKEIELAYGKNLPKPERIEGDYPVYGSNGIVGTHHEFLIDFPSIVIGRKGTVGSIHKTNAKFWPTDVSFYVKINDSKKLQLDFVFYLLHFLNLPKYSQSGPKSGLNRNDVYKIECVLPPLPTQKQIVAKLDHILGELKVKKKEILSLIEQNKERIDFFEKNWILYVIDREIENHPQRKEWKLKELNQLNNIISGNAFKSTEFTKSGIPVITISNVGHGLFIDKSEKFLPIEFEKKYSQFLVKSNYILLALTRPFTDNNRLKVCKTSNLKNSLLNQRVAMIVPSDNIDVNFLLNAMQTTSFKKQTTENLSTSLQPNLSSTKLPLMTIPNPPLSTQKEIVKNIKSAEEKFQSQKKQFENIKNNYESKIKYINHIQSSVLDSAFSGKLLN